MKKKAIVVTGVSSGIGKATASILIRRGFRVFGTVRNESDAAALKTELKESFVPVVMDVCSTAQINEAAQFITKQLNGETLTALVNNAGMAKPGPLEYQDLAEIKAQFDVNVFGLLDVTKAFLPLLKNRDASKSGRIINVSSIAGKIAAPYLGAYAATKHAVEALSHSLRRELMPFGVDVVMVGPGNVRTPIWEKVSDLSVYDHTPHKKYFRIFLSTARNEAKKGMQPEEIGNVILKILENKNPATRYAPVAQKFANWTLPNLLSDRTVDNLIFKNLEMEKV